jgi:hypothetical protein
LRSTPGRKTKKLQENDPLWQRCLGTDNVPESKTDQHPTTFKATTISIRKKDSKTLVLQINRFPISNYDKLITLFILCLKMKSASSLHL